MNASIPAPFAGHWPAVAESVPAARQAIATYLRQTETPDPPLGDVALVVSEAMTNAVVHAYAGQDVGEVRIEVEFAPDELKLVVEDDGGGLVPRLDSPGLGLGLPLIATLSDRFDTKTSPGRGTRLCAWFRRDPREATLPD